MSKPEQVKLKLCEQRLSGEEWEWNLVFHGDRVPGHVDAFDWSKRSEGLSDCVLPQLVVDRADVDSTHNSQSSLTLSRHLKHTQRSVFIICSDNKTISLSPNVLGPHMKTAGGKGVGLPGQTESGAMVVRLDCKMNHYSSWWHHERTRSSHPHWGVCGIKTCSDWNKVAWTEENNWR